MIYIFGAEHYNWLLDQEGVTKVTMVDSMTSVDFKHNKQAEEAFEDLANYDINRYSICENRIIIRQDT